MLRIVDITEPSTDIDMSFILMYSKEDYMGLIFRKDHINIIRCNPDVDIIIMQTTTKKIYDFIEEDRTSVFGPQIVLKKGYHDLRVTLDMTVPIPVNVFDEDLAEKMIEVVEIYEKDRAHKKALYIQKNVRRWIAKRRYSKDRMYMFNQLESLPPKYIVSSFPGGNIYRKSFKNFMDSINNMV